MQAVALVAVRGLVDLPRSTSYSMDGGASSIKTPETAGGLRSTDGKTLARTVLVIVTLFVVAVYYLPLGHYDFYENWLEGTYGADTTRSSNRVVSVDPNSPAARAGIAAGDRIGRNRFGTEWALFGFPYAGDQRSFTIVRDGVEQTVHLKAAAIPDSGLLRRLGSVLAILPATVFLIVAFLMVWARPSAMTWSFFVYAVGYFGTAPSYAYFAHVLPAPAFEAMTFCLGTLFSNFAVLPLLPFVMRFPYDHTYPWWKPYSPFVWTAIGVAFLAYVYAWYIAQSTGHPPAFQSVLDSFLPLLVFALAALVMIKNFKLSPPQTRQRFGFLIVGTVTSFVAYAVYFIPNVSAQVSQTVQLGAVLMPISVGYAVFRHRVIDVNFVLNRAVVYGALSVCVIAFVSLLDWFSSRTISEFRLATAIELLVTIGIGFMLDRINRTVESAVESVLFRRRHIVERYLLRVAAALPYATSEDAITDGLVHEPVEALELTAGALYRPSDDGSRFTGVGTSSQTLAAPMGFDGNHNLVRFLQAEESPVWLDDVRTHLDATNSSIYVLAIPVMVRHQLVSFVLYGAHRNGAQIDPDEVGLLKEIGREAARAYDHVEAVRTRELLRRLEANAPPVAPV
ncbi:MAG: hypothetical protein ACXVAO_17575 [Vulcanimicrobiaceae bacterium]